MHSRAAPIGRSARSWAHAIDASLTPARPAGSPLADAVESLGIAVRACRSQLGMRAGPWELAVAVTGGLLHGRPPDPGF